MFVLYSDKKAVLSEYIAPAVTPRKDVQDGKKYAHNPAFRIVEYDDAIGKIENYYQYWFDLPDTDDSLPTWLLEYDFKTAYNTNDLQPESANQVLQKLKEDEQLWKQWVKRNSVSLKNDIAIPCDCKCKKRNLCAIQEVDIDENKECYEAGVKACADTSGASSQSRSVTLVAIVLFVTNMFM